MRKTYLVVVIALIAVALSLINSGCGSTGQQANKAAEQVKSDQSKPAGESAEKKDLPKKLVMGTMPMGSQNNAVGSGLASMISKYSPIEVTVMATSGPTEFAPMMKTGEVDLGVAATFDAQVGYLGTDVYEALSKGQGFPFRLVTSGSVNIYNNLVARDSGIITAADVKGKRYVGEITGSANASALARAFLVNHNLTRDDVKWITVPGVTDGIRGIIEGRVDISGSLMGTGAAQELEAAKGARFLSIDPSPEAMKRLQKEFPAFAVRVEPGPGNVGIIESTYMMGYNNYLIARADLMEEAVYAVVKALWENNEELRPIHTGLNDWVADNFVSEHASIPYHPGAIKFYKEQGVWNENMDKLQQQLLSAK